MTTTLDRDTPAAAPAVSAPQRNGGALGLLRGEWVKLRSLRSTWLTLGIGLLLMVLLSWLFTATAGSTGGGPGGEGDGPGAQAATDPIGLSLAGHQLAQLAIGTLGVLLVTGEYASATVRSTFAAVPRRWPVVVAKAAVFAVVVFLGSLVAAAASFLIGQAALGDLGVGIGADGALRAVFGTALYLAAIGLLGMAFGWLLRSTAAGISILFGLLFLAPVLGQLLPSSWGPDLLRWLPGEAGGQLLSVVSSADSFGPWTGFAVLVGWLVVAFGAATTLLRRRDA